MNQQAEKFPGHFLNPDYEKGTFESITADIDPITDKIIEITGRYDFKEDFEKKLSLRNKEAKKEIESMLMEILIGGGSQKAVGSILLDELNQILVIGDSKFSETSKFEETIQDLINYISEKFSVSINQPKVLIPLETYNSRFELKYFVNKPLLQELFDMAIDKDIIDDTDDNVSFEKFYNSLTLKDPSKEDYIKFNCKNSKLKSFILVIQPLFDRLNSITIGEVGVFITKQNKPLSTGNYNKIKEDINFFKKMNNEIQPLLPVE